MIWSWITNVSLALEGNNHRIESSGSLPLADFTCPHETLRLRASTREACLLRELQ